MSFPRVAFFLKAKEKKKEGVSQRIPGVGGGRRLVVLLLPFIDPFILRLSLKRKAFFGRLWFLSCLAEWSEAVCMYMYVYLFIILFFLFLMRLSMLISMLYL